MVYRVWARIRTSQLLQLCHEQALPTVGPRLSTRSLRGYVADFVAEEDAAGGSPSRVVLDIIKAFNVMRRPLVTAVMLHFGLPSNIVLAWMKALDAMERQILVAGCVYPAAEDLKSLRQMCRKGTPCRLSLCSACVFSSLGSFWGRRMLSLSRTQITGKLSHVRSVPLSLFCRRFTSSSSFALYLFRLRSAGCGVLVTLGANGSNRLRSGILIPRCGYRQLTLGLICLTAKDVPQQSATCESRLGIAGCNGRKVCLVVKWQKSRLIMSGIWPQCLHGSETCVVPKSVLKRCVHKRGGLPPSPNKGLARG